MNVVYFAIRDGSKRKATPCAFMRYSHEDGFIIDIEPGANSNEVPAFFSPFVEKNELHLNPELSMQWVRERIPPSSRQNIGEILAAHGLNEYSELELLRSTRGISSQDNFIIEEIDKAFYDSRQDNRVSNRRRKLGETIRSHRVALGLTQRELADVVGIDQPFLSRIESGKSNVTFDVLVDIDEALSHAGSGIVTYCIVPLWNKERQRICDVLEKVSSLLPEIYAKLVDELERYSETRESAIADSLVITHCFRELINGVSDYVDSSLRLESAKNQENDMPLVARVSVDPWFEAEQQMNATMHLLGESGMKIPSLVEYHECLSLFDKAIAALSDDVFYVDADLEALIKRANLVDARGAYAAPSKEEIQTVLSALRDDRARSWVLRKLKNPRWLEPLKQAGYSTE